MALRSRQKLWHRIAFSWITIISLFIVAIILANGVWGMYNKNAHAKERAHDSVMELTKLQEREVSLSENLEHIKTTKGIEEELRRKFDVAKNGEHLLVIIDKEIEPDAQNVRKSWLSEFWSKIMP